MWEGLVLGVLRRVCHIHSRTGIGRPIIGWVSWLRRKDRRTRLPANTAQPSVLAALASGIQASAYTARGREATVLAVSYA